MIDIDDRSRLDGEKPEEDEIRTKEDGQDEVHSFVTLFSYLEVLFGAMV